MSVTLAELLQPQLVLELITRVRPGQGMLGRWLGFQPERYDPQSVSLSGPNTIGGGPLNALRQVTYRVFNATRTVPTARAPGTGPNTNTPNPMGAVTVTCPRFHDKIPLLYEFLANLSPMVGPNSNIDQNGQNYVQQQQTYLAEKYGKGVEMMAAGMMRDSLYFNQSTTTPSTLLMSFSAPASGQFGFQVNFQIPSGNKSQLNMLGAGNIIDVSWADPGAPILTHLMKIKAAFAQLHGYPLTDVWINSTMWINIIQNTQVRNTGGTSNTVFAEYTMQPDSSGVPNQYQMVLRADPTIRWHINDQVLSLNSDIDFSYSTVSSGTATKLIPDSMAIFCTDMADRQLSNNIAKFYLGGEPVVENPGMPAVMRTGYYYWNEYTTQPSAIELLALLNGVPTLYTPAAFAPATVVF